MTLEDIGRTLAREVDRLEFASPVTHVYNPLVYAGEPYATYVRRYGQGSKQALLLGMNPGPYGMAQTGVPFGDPKMVHDFLGIDGPVGRPEREHPRRPVMGFACPRHEVSGRRLWGWVQQRFGQPDRFFERFLVLNYCPLVFLEASGRNRTPDKLPRAEQTPLLELCDKALADEVALVQPEAVIGIGAFAESRLRAALPGFKGRIGRLLHPSPASPAANHGWASRAEAQLQALGLLD